MLSSRLKSHTRAKLRGTSELHNKGRARLTIPFRIDSLAFNDGTSVDTSEARIVVFVGPNNSGKTKTLQELSTLLARHPNTRFDESSLVVLQGGVFRPFITVEALNEWLIATRYSWVEKPTERTHVRTPGSGGDQATDETARYWNAEGRLGPLANHLIKGLWCVERLTYVESPMRLDSGQHPDRPVQVLVRNRNQMKLFRTAFKAAFKRDVIVDAWGQHIRLRVSEDERQEDFAIESASGLPDAVMASRLERVPLLNEQSDGVKAFAGILLTLLTTPYPLILLDEPEAFLHPPQARLLGEYLSKLSQRGQLMIATHSLDILLGLLSGDPAGVHVVRLKRDEEKTSPFMLSPERVKSLWQDPLLRFSRAFDGLFHEGVVICEGDSDSQFYSTVAYHLADHLREGTGAADPSGASDDLTNQADAVAEDQSAISFSENPFDVMFTYAGSKQRIAMVCAALSAVEVPTCAVVDFDFLRDEDDVKSIVEALGGSYDDDLQALVRVVDAGLRGHEGVVNHEDALQQITEILSGGDSRVTKSQSREIRAALEPKTGWTAAKKMGRPAVPSGDPSAALTRLMERLAELRLFVVPVGTVESFVKDVPSTSRRWVVEVIEGDYVKDAKEAHDFVRQVLEALITPAQRAS